MPDARHIPTEQELAAAYQAAEAAYRIAIQRAVAARASEFYARQRMCNTRAAYHAHPAVQARHEAAAVRELSSTNS